MFLDPSTASLSHLFDFLDYFVYRLSGLLSMTLCSALLLWLHWRIATLHRPKRKPRSRKGSR